MKKKIAYTTTGYLHQILGMEILNFFPTKHTQAIYHFVFLDYNPPRLYKALVIHVSNGSFTHSVSKKLLKLRMMPGPANTAL